MPVGNVSTVDRFRRLQSMKELVEDGKSNKEISDELGMSLPTVMRSRKYLDDLAVADLTSKEIGDKRQELYLELSEATSEAKALFEKYRDGKESTSNDIKKFFSSWLEAIQAKAKLYGLDSMKVDSLIQVNTQNNYKVVPDTISTRIQEKIAKSLIDGHEEKLRAKHENG